MLATEQQQNDRFLFINHKNMGKNKEKYEIDLVMFTYYGNLNVVIVNIRRLNGAYLYLEI